MSEVTVTGDATATITSGVVPANKTIKRRGKSLSLRNQVMWEARNEKYKTLWHDYYTLHDRQNARFDMASAIWDELHKAALKVFVLKSAEGWNKSATDQMHFAAEEFTQDSVIGTICKLDNGSFERGDDASSFNAFRAYVTKMKRVSNCRAQDELIKLNKFTPAMTDESEEDDDGEQVESEDATVGREAQFDGNGNPLALREPEFIQFGKIRIMPS